jgi:MoxR-like ATPase
VGKTTLPKLFAKDTVGSRSSRLVAGSIKSLGDLVQKIDEGLAKFSATIPGVGVVEPGELKLVPFRGNEKERLVPPCVVFIDEVHDLDPKVVNGMLTGTENADRYLVTESGVKVMTDYVCFIIATTNREMLFDPFDTRFTKLYLRYYNTKEMGQIVKLKNPDWTSEMCLYVARYASRVPREADDFAKDVREELHGQRRPLEGRGGRGRPPERGRRHPRGGRRLPCR